MAQDEEMKYNEVSSMVDEVIERDRDSRSRTNSVSDSERQSSKIGLSSAGAKQRRVENVDLRDLSFECDVP